MAELERGFEESLKRAIVDDVERKTLARADNLAHEFIDTANENLREYGRRHDYNVEPVIESAKVLEASRTENGVHVRIEWDHAAASIFETGTSDHTVRGDPLAFVWEDPPQWVREQFEQARGGRGEFRRGWQVFLNKVEVSGVPAARYVRNAITSFQAKLQRRGEFGRFI